MFCNDGSDFEKLSSCFGQIFELLDEWKHAEKLDERNYVHISQSLSRCMMMFSLIDQGHNVIEY